MDDVSVNITGLSELQAQLERLGGTEAKAIVKDGLSQGGDALRQSMMVGVSSVFSGEPRQVAAQKSNWSRSVKLDGDLAGIVRVSPKGSLPELHKSDGKGRQPLNKLYRRSLKYLIKMCEFGTSGGKERGALGRSMPMTKSFEQYRGAVLERVVDVIKTRLHLD